jgi:hypothetical protein
VTGMQNVVIERTYRATVQRYCPTCVRKERKGLPPRGRKLMALPIPRRVRFHDLRHTTASLPRAGLWRLASDG